MSKKIILIIVALPLIIIGGAYLLPSKTEVSRSIAIESDVQSVFDMVNNFKNAQRWSPWAEKDPSMEVVFKGPDSGGGALMTWKSNNSQVGSGSQEIIESQALKMVHINLIFDGQTESTAYFYLEKLDEKKTKLTWSFIAEHRNSPLQRYMGLMLDTWVGTDYELGLNKLKTLLESDEEIGLSNISEETSKVVMVDEKGQPLELTEEEFKAFNEKKAQKTPEKIPDAVKKAIEQSYQKVEKKSDDLQKPVIKVEEEASIPPVKNNKAPLNKENY